MQEIRSPAFPLLHIVPFIIEVNCVEYDMDSQQDGDRDSTVVKVLSYKSEG